LLYLSLGLAEIVEFQTNSGQNFASENFPQYFFDIFCGGPWITLLTLAAAPSFYWTIAFVIFSLIHWSKPAPSFDDNLLV